MNLGRKEDWISEAAAFSRAFGGAFLFGIPLLYTMETWWIGEYAQLWKLVIFLALGFVANLGLVYFAGFRRKVAAGWDDILDQAIDALAVGIIGSIIVLVVLNRIQFGDPLVSVMGKIIVQAVPLSIGASLAGAVFRTDVDRQGDQEEQPERHGWKATLNDIGATMIGATFLGFAIAPTEEIPMLAAEMALIHEVALVILSLIVGYVIVFVSGFDPDARPAKHLGPLQHPSSETAVAYVVSLLVAFVALYLFDQIELGDPLVSTLTQVLVLGLPTTVGGAAGRLAV